MALGRLTSFTFGNSFLTLVYANSQTYYVSYAHIIAGESDSRSGDLTIWIYTAGEVGETLSVKNSDLVAIGSSATAFLALFNQNIQPYSYWQDFLDSTTASGALPSEPSALRGQCLYARFRPIYNFGSASLINVPARFKAGTLYSQVPDTGAGDFTVTRATTPTAGRSTRINKDGLIELVADNVPRLDYPLGGAVNGCPALLVEPSAQNQCQRSEEFNNAFHFPNNLNAFGSGSVANTTATRDPYGTNLADYIQENSAASAQHSIIDIFAGNVSGTTYTWSVFAKSAERTIIQLANNAGGGGVANFNLTTGVATLTNGVSCSMQNYGNGWWRCILTYTANATGNHNVQIRLCDASGNSTYNGTGNQGAYIFGAQVETGSVATSYIPTTTQAITRAADIVRKTGITSLIGQSEGTVYFEVEVTDEARNKWFCSLDSASNSFIQMWVSTTRSISVSISNGGSTVMTTLASSALSVGYHKVAFAYNTATNGCIMYIDGVQNPVATRTVVAPGLPAFNDMSVGTFRTSNSDALKAHIRAEAVCPNRLSNSELATLTTP